MTVLRRYLTAPAPPATTHAAQERCELCAAADERGAGMSERSERIMGLATHAGDERSEERA